jgi:hypothetical protein
VRERKRGGERGTHKKLKKQSLKQRKKKDRLLNGDYESQKSRGRKV